MIGQNARYTALMSYSNELIAIDEFMLNMNEKSTFQMTNGNNISFEKYYSSLTRCQIKPEQCLIRFGRNYYLPQFMILSANNELLSIETKNTIRNQFSNLTAARVINESLQLHDDLNNISNSTRKIFSANINRDQNNRPIPTTVKAYYLNIPDIYIKDRNMQHIRISALEGTSKKWHQMGYVAPPPFLNNIANNNNRNFRNNSTNNNNKNMQNSNVNSNTKWNRQMLPWIIVYARKHEQQARQAKRVIHDIISKQFGSSAPLSDPILFAMDLDNDLPGIRTLLRKDNDNNNNNNNNRKYCLALIIIDDHEHGRKTKMNITRYLHFEQIPTRIDGIGSHDNNGNNGNNDNRNVINIYHHATPNKQIETQFVLQSRVGHFGAMKNIAESM